MFTTHRQLLLLHLCAQSNLSQSISHSDVRQQWLVLGWTCFVVVDALPSRPSVIRVTQRLFSRSARSFGHPPLYLSILPTTSFLVCAKEDWLMLPKATTLQVETPLLNWTKVWCFYSWDNGGIWPQMILQIVPCVLWNQGYTMHKKSHNVLSYAMHKEMSMLEE
jgi:hypothetical protein